MEYFAFFTQLLLLALGIFLMIVILLQRGRGGGLAGAFGGLGGQSAFGTKAGDVFTKITIVMAVLWVLVAGSSGLLLRQVGEGTRAKDIPEVETGVSSAEGEEDDAVSESPETDETGEEMTLPDSENDTTATPPVDNTEADKTESKPDDDEASETAPETDSQG